MPRLGALVSSVPERMACSISTRSEQWRLRVGHRIQRFPDLVSKCSYSFENRRGRYAFRDRVVVPLGLAPVVLTSPFRMPLLPDMPCTRS